MIKNFDGLDLKISSKIHYEGMKHDFLPGFGLEFLTALYSLLIAQSEVLHLGFYEKGVLVGFILATTNTDVTMKQVFLKGVWKLAPYILMKIVRSPKTLHNIWETVFYGKIADGIPAEILILAIDKKYRRKGIGKKLLSRLKEELLKKGVKKFKVGTLSSNIPANKFYTSTSGIFIYSHEVYDHMWNVYRYELIS